MRAREKKKKEATPDMFSLLDARDYTGAITLIEFERKMFLDKKHGVCDPRPPNARPFPGLGPCVERRRARAAGLAWRRAAGRADAPCASFSLAQLAAGALAGGASTSGWREGARR